MKRTSAITLIAFGVIGVAGGIFVQVALAGSGQPGIKPPLTLAVGLAVIGVIDIALAWPIRTVAKGGTKSRVDPFYATRVVVLAKASSMSGALLTGAAAGFVAYFLSRSVPAVGSVGFSIATLAGAVVLMVCGLIAEHMCTLPPDEGDEKQKKKKPAEA